MGISNSPSPCSITPHYLGNIAEALLKLSKETAWTQVGLVSSGDLQAQTTEAPWTSISSDITKREVLSKLQIWWFYHFFPILTSSFSHSFFLSCLIWPKIYCIHLYFFKKIIALIFQREISHGILCAASDQLFKSPKRKSWCSWIVHRKALAYTGQNYRNTPLFRIRVSGNPKIQLTTSFGEKVWFQKFFPKRFFWMHIQCIKYNHTL